MNRPAHYTTPRTVLAIAGAALALVTTAGCGSGASGTSKRPATAKAEAPTRLLAKVGTGGLVTLTTSNGRAVTRLPSGWYTVLVRVNSPNADFHLIGQSVNSVTKAGGSSVALWGIHLLKGTYRYMNDHARHGAAHVLRVY